jgi:hypothetical protein
MANSGRIREKPRWMLSGNKVFRTSGTVADCWCVEKTRLVFLLWSMAGLVLVTDKSVGCFLKGGKMIELMAAIGGFKLVLRAPLLDERKTLGRVGRFV